MTRNVHHEYRKNKELSAIFNVFSVHVPGEDIDGGEG